MTAPLGEVERYDRMIDDLLLIVAEVTNSLPREGKEAKMIIGVIFSIAEFISETRGSRSLCAADALVEYLGLDASAL